MILSNNWLLIVGCQYILLGRASLKMCQLINHNKRQFKVYTKLSFNVYNIWKVVEKYYLDASAGGRSILT